MTSSGKIGAILLEFGDEVTDKERGSSTGNEASGGVSFRFFVGEGCPEAERGMRGLLARGLAFGGWEPSAAPMMELNRASWKASFAASEVGVLRLLCSLSDQS